MQVSGGKLTCVHFNCRYPYNNFLHHHVEQIILSCLESKKAPLIKHLLHDCNLVGKILEAEKNSTLTVDMNKVLISFCIYSSINVTLLFWHLHFI